MLLDLLFNLLFNRCRTEVACAALYNLRGKLGFSSRICHCSRPLAESDHPLSLPSPYPIPPIPNSPCPVKPHIPLAAKITTWLCWVSLWCWSQPWRYGHTTGSKMPCHFHNTWHQWYEIPPILCILLWAVTSNALSSKACVLSGFWQDLPVDPSAQSIPMARIEAQRSGGEEWVAPLTVGRAFPMHWSDNGDTTVEYSWAIMLAEERKARWIFLSEGRNIYGVQPCPNSEHLLSLRYFRRSKVH